MKRAAIVIAAVLLLATPVVLLSAFVRGSIADDVAARSTHDRLRAAQLAAALLDNELEEAGGAIGEKVAEHDVIAALRQRDLQTLTNELGALGAAWPQFTSALAIDPNGILLAVGGVPPGRLSGANGTSPSSGEGTGATPQARSERDYFVGALGSTGAFVSEAYTSNAPGQPVVIAVSKAIRDGGTLLGVIVVTVSPKELLDTVAPVNDVDGRELLIIDKSHHVIASSDTARAPLTTADLPELDRALAGKPGSSTALIEGQSRVLTYTPVPRAKWALYVVDDPSIVLALERDLQQNISLGATGALLAALVFGGVIAGLFATILRRQEQLARSQLALTTTNAELETANRHKSEFLSSMSHELRTPMNAILGFSDLLDEQLHERITDRQRRYFGNIREAGEHLLSLINDVLDLSKIESGRIELRPEVVTVQQLLEPVLANSRREASARSLRFEWSVSDETASLRLDAGRVRQVLYNLTSNALKFTPAGEVALNERIEGDDLLLEVSDTGIGIPEGRQSRVFGMFERLNEDRSEASGTGLGLALSQRLVEMHGGSINFTSVEGGGTTFRVRLPGVVVGSEAEDAEERYATAAG